MANMISLFGFWASGKQARRESRAGYAEALLAGWVPPLPEVRVRIEAATRATEEKSDTMAFLARVYLHQQC